MGQGLNETVLRMYQDIEGQLDEQNAEGKDALARIKPELLHLYVSMNPDSVNYLTLKNLENRDFFVALMICICRRAPTETDWASWEHRIRYWPQERFQHALIRDLTLSGESRAKGTWLDHYALDIPHRRWVFLRSAEGRESVLYDKLHGVYSRLPFRVRVLIKRMAPPQWRRG